MYLLKNIISQSIAHPLIFLRIFFEEQEILILINTNLLVSAFVVSPRNCCLPQGRKDIFLYFLLEALQF